jgi:hypothetical protein
MFWNSWHVDARVRDWEFVPSFPVGLCSISLTAKDIFRTRCTSEPIPRSHDRERGGGTLKIFQRNPLLAYKFLTDQFSRHRQAHLRLPRECLGSPQSRVGWIYWAYGYQDLAKAVEHYEGSILICQPAKGSQGNVAVRPDYDQPFKTVTYARQPPNASFGSDSIL